MNKPEPSLNILASRYKVPRSLHPWHGLRTTCVLLLMIWPTASAAAFRPDSTTSHAITVKAKEAIDQGLAYLARVQNRDGSFSNRGRYGSYPVAMSSLAGIALLMDGNTTTQGRYAPQVDRIVNFLLKAKRHNGEIALLESEGRPMYGHGFAMLFLSQLYGMSEDPAGSKEIHDLLVGAVQLTAQAQSSLGGWYYTANSRSDEGSVTITQVQALRSCRNAGITVPKDVIDLAMDYLGKSQNNDGGIRYSARQRQGTSRPAITAAAVCCWFNAGQYNNRRAKRAMAYCKNKIKPRKTQGGHDFYAHLYMAQAMFISDDPDWNDYYKERRDFLIGRQNPDGSWQGDGVGDIYGTALALTLLQLPYNQLPIMQR